MKLTYDKNPDPVRGQVEVEKTAELLDNHTSSGAVTQADAAPKSRTALSHHPAASRSPESLQDRRDRARRQREERQAKYEHWLEHGSDRLEDAWVSICPYAQSHDVQPMLLTEVVEAIQTGGPIPVVTKWGTKDFYLDDNQAKVRRLYAVGCHEAEILNRPRIRRLLENLGLKVDLSQVRVLTEQPKENTKLFYVSALVVDGTSCPVRERVVYHINTEHFVRLQDLEFLVRENPFVPAGREPIFIRGLFAGLSGDFLVAASLLVPQVENSLRHLLYHYAAEPRTSKLKDDLTQPERDLNELLYRDDVKQIIGEDLLFDLQSLLVEPGFGVNLRNQLAHGLMDVDQFYGDEAVYTWWLVWRICCVPSLMRMQKEAAKGDPTSTGAAAPPGEQQTRGAS